MIVSQTSRLQIATGGWAWSGSPIEEDMSNTCDIVGERERERERKKKKGGGNLSQKVHACRP
jgi:hypothetical protein